MNCNEATEFVSALFDGETIPRTAADHIGTCEACRAHMKEYLEIGVELRRIASIVTAEEAPPLNLEKRKAWSTNWWQKGWGTMRIPRFAFAALVAGVAVLGSSLAVVGVRVHARTQGTVVLLKQIPPSISPTSGPLVCALSTIDKNQDPCGYVGKVNGGWLVYDVKLLSSDGDRIELGVRSRFLPPGSSETPDSNMVDSLPESTHSFELGKSLEVNVPGAGTIIFSGEWTDHMPPTVAGTTGVDPGPGEVRISSPLLILDKKVVGDMQGMSASADKTGQAVTIYYPGQGLFQLSLAQLPGAVPGKLQQNRVTFESAGETYTIVTGVPITREAELWVTLEADYRPDQNQQEGFIGAGDPKVWVKQ